MRRGRSTTLLVNPPQTLYAGSQRFSKSFPLGLAYVAAVLEQAGHPVEILDTLITHSERRKRDGTEQLGMSWKRIRRAIEERHPDIVGITCPFTTQIENASRVSAIVKEIDPDILTVLGGPDASVRASDILKQVETLDVAVIGEGEYTMLELVARHDRGDMGGIENITGIAYRKGREVVVNPRRDFIGNLDELPLPAYHLFDMDAYLDPRDEQLYAWRCRMRSRQLPVITSRGCPYDCVFCSVHLHMGKKWRPHSAGRVLDHLSFLTQRYGVNHIHFEDDNFTLNRRRALAILDGLLEKVIQITWDTPNGVRADLLGRDMLAKMKQTGCLSLTVGVESGDQQVLERIVGKRLELTRVVDTARACQEVGLPLQAFFVVGFPGERIENIERSVAFGEMLAESHGVNLHFLVATPLPGTRLHQICRDEGYLVKEPTPRALAVATQADGEPLIRTESFGPEDLKRILIRQLERAALRERQRQLREASRRFARLGRAGGFLAALYVSRFGRGSRAALRPLVWRVRSAKSSRDRRRNELAKRVTGS